jgi:hypothetical protein
MKRASRFECTVAIASKRCSTTSSNVAARAGRNGALPVIARLIFDPTTIATKMSSGVRLEKVRRPAMRMQRMP